MAEEIPEIRTRYRLTLEFDVSINTEILGTYSDEDELSTKEKRQLAAQRSLMRALLHHQYRYLLDELIRKRVLEDAAFEVGYETVRDASRVRDITEDLLLEPVIDTLSVQDQQYYQDAVEHKRFGKDAEDVVNSVCVDLNRSLLLEVDPDDNEW